MLSTRLVCTLVVCVAIGSVVMALPAPQFRFGMPAHFSFRTVHTPFQSGRPSQAPNTFFFRQPRLTATSAKTFIHTEATDVQEPQSSPALKEETHVPVFVPVQSDFQGDSVVVSSDDLVNMGLTGTLENTDGTVDQAPAAMDNVVPTEDISLAPVADIQTVSQDAVNLEESQAGPLSFADDAFVLTASEAQPEPVDLASPVDSIIESEVIPQEIPSVEPVVLQTFDPTTTVSPFQTETFNAYNQFINHWLQLASVNLNRPDLLELVNIQPTPSVQAQPEPQVMEVQKSVVSDAQPEVFEPVETIQAGEYPQPEITEIIEEIPVVEETLPVETVTEGVISDLTSMDVTTELPFAEYEVTTENLGVTEATLVEEVTPAAEPIPEVTFENLQPEVVEPAAVVAETIPEATVETIQTEVVEPAAAIVEQDIATNIIPDTPVQVSASAPIPAHFNTIPTYTSRGRLSGFRYSFSHVPQRGTFFFNSVAA